MMKFLMSLFFFIKIIFIYGKILLHTFGLGGWLTIFLFRKNIIHWIWWPLSIVVSKILLPFYSMEWLSGIVGIIIGTSPLALFFHIFNIIFILYYVNQQTYRPNNYYHKINLKFSDIRNILKNFYWKIYKIKIKKNKFFTNIIMEWDPHQYPWPYLFYDMKIFFKYNLKILTKPMDQYYKTTISINNGNLLTSQTFKKIIFQWSLLNWKFLLAKIVSRNNYLYIGINENGDPMIFPIHKFLKFYIINKNLQLTSNYINNYIFKNIFKGDFIVYIINQQPNNNIMNHYNFLLKTMEKCFTQAKFNGKSIVLFLYYQLTPLKKYKNLLNNLNMLMDQWCLYFNIIIIEENIIHLDNFFKNLNNSGWLINNTSTMDYSRNFTGSMGFNEENWWILKTYDNIYNILLVDEL